MSFAAEVAGRFAREALEGGPGEVCAVFRRSFYLRFPGERYACVGERSLGRGPLNALVATLELPAPGARVSVRMDAAAPWTPERFTAQGAPDLDALRRAASSRAPAEGLGCLVAGGENALASYALPSLAALNAWLAGNSLDDEAQALIGLGPGLTPSGDDYFGGVLVALRSSGRAAQAGQLWRWLQPRLGARTSAISAAHLEAAAAGEAHEALHACIHALYSGEDWEPLLGRLDAVGHCSGWDGLAGVVAVARTL